MPSKIDELIRRLEARAGEAARQLDALIDAAIGGQEVDPTEVERLMVSVGWSIQRLKERIASKRFYVTKQEIPGFVPPGMS